MIANELMIEEISNELKTSMERLRLARHSDADFNSCLCLLGIDNKVADDKLEIQYQAFLTDPRRI